MVSSASEVAAITTFAKGHDGCSLASLPTSYTTPWDTIASRVQSRRPHQKNFYISIGFRRGAAVGCRSGIHRQFLKRTVFGTLKSRRFGIEAPAPLRPLAARSGKSSGEMKSPAYLKRGRCERSIGSAVATPICRFDHSKTRPGLGASLGSRCSWAGSGTPGGADHFGFAFGAGTSRAVRMPVRPRVDVERPLAGEIALQMVVDVAEQLLDHRHAFGVTKSLYANGLT